jgi:hypothetical protein
MNAFRLHLRCWFWITIVVMGTGGFVHAQLATRATHQNTPDNCMAYIWWNRIQWDSLWQETYTYSVGGLLMEARRDVFVTGQGLEPLYNYVYAYDGLGRKTDKIQQIWNGTGYDNQVRESWTYDSRGADSLLFQYQWVFTPFGYAWDTMGGSRFVHIYTPTGDVATQEHSIWTPTTSGSYWENFSKTEYSFSPALEWDTVVFYNNASGNWAAHSRWVDLAWHDYTQRQAASYIVQTSSGGWTDLQRITCSYNGLDSDCIFEGYSGAWDTTGREYRLYDAGSHLTKREKWQRQNNLWSVENGDVHLYTYDSLGRHIETVDQYWDPTVGYLNANRYVYGSFFVGLENAVMLSLDARVYPNPLAAGDRLHIVLETRPGPVTFTLHDLQGRLRLQCQAAYTGAEIEVPISQTLEQGQYIYEIRTREGRAQGKVMLQR